MKNTIKMMIVVAAIMGWSCVGACAMSNVISLPGVLVLTSILTFIGVIASGGFLVGCLIWALFVE